MLPHLTHSGKRHASYPFCFLGWWSPALSSSGTVLTLPAPESVPPSPGIRGTVPITGFGVSKSVGGGEHCCLGFTWEACGKHSLTFTPVFWITENVALGFSQSARHLQSPCWLQVRVKRSGWISKGWRSRLSSLLCCEFPSWLDSSLLVSQFQTWESQKPSRSELGGELWF